MHRGIFRKNIDKFRIYDKISSGKCKCSAEKKNDISCRSERGTGESPLQKLILATSKRPGKTGTGAPVTEQLRYCAFVR